jgi:hypothetical protein
MPVRRTMPRHRPDGGTEEVDRTPEDVAPAPAWPASARGLSPAQLLALQRSGAGNRLLARAFGDELESDEDEEAEDAGGAAPLLLTDRPWSEIEGGRPPAPFPPAPDLEFPIILPREQLPPELLAMFGLQPPAQEEPLLLLEYHPMEPETPETETPEAEAAEPEAQVEAEAEPVAETTSKPRKKKKKKTKEPVAPPPQKPPQEMSVEEAMAFIGEKAPAPKKQKQQKQPKQNKQQLEARQKKAAAEKAAEEEDARQRKLEAAKNAVEQEKQHKIVKDTLTIRLADLQAARDAHPNTAAYRDIRKEADDEAKALDTWLKGPAGTASVSELQSRLASVNKLIFKVEQFEPPETPAQRRLRKFNEVRTNVAIKLADGKWDGAFGGETDFSVDKYDPTMRGMIQAEYGRDTVEVPGHGGKDYPGKTKTTKVYYYVTYSSHTAGIAYDISLHPYEGNTQLKTVFVLHIPHKPN